MKTDEIGLLLDLLKIYSPPLREEKLSGFLADKMRGDLGFRNVRIDEVNNVLGELGSGEPLILLCGHMDTVPGWLPAKARDGRVYGRGAVDAKSSLAAMILAASRLGEQSLLGRVLMAAAVDEEGNGLGVRQLIKDGLKVEYGVFGEPSGVGCVTVGYKGSLALRILCRTPSGHASAPWMHESAVEKIFKIWKAIQAYASEREVKDNHYRSLSACLTKIRGGSVRNVIPGRCEIFVDVRVPPSMSSKKILKELRDVILSFHSEYSHVEVEAVDMTEPYETDRSSLIVRALVRSVLEVRGKRPTLLYKTGTGDMNILGNALNASLVTYGPGDPRLSHTDREYVEVSEFLESIRVYHGAVLNIFKLLR